MNHTLLWAISISALVPQFSIVLTFSPTMYTILIAYILVELIMKNKYNAGQKQKEHYLRRFMDSFCKFDHMHILYMLLATVSKHHCKLWQYEQWCNCLYLENGMRQRALQCKSNSKPIQTL